MLFRADQWTTSLLETAKKWRVVADHSKEYRKIKTRFILGFTFFLLLSGALLSFIGLLFLKGFPNNISSVPMGIPSACPRWGDTDR
jgi:hypothetical protein